MCIRDSKYSIPADLISSFLDSMKMDLDKKEYDTVEEYKKYIYGSADVVGLMCLRVFVDGSENLYNELSPFAISLGSAFQKVNFLRDIKDDSNILNRVYFPNVDMDNFNEDSKKEIIEEIEEDFKNAVKGIIRLPKNSKFALKALYKTTDEIWRAVGDRSTDISFYTKRGILAGVYSTTKMSWLGSLDPDLSKVEEFIERRLKNVKLLGSITKPLKENLNKRIVIFWTGDNVISEKIDNSSLKSIQDFFKNPIAIWDNFYANDYCPSLSLIHISEPTRPY